MERTASCGCGQLTARCQGEPAQVSLCHCLACQRRTGAPFGVAAFFPREEVAVQGRTRRYARDADNGHEVTFHFCPDCGSTVYWEPHRMPGLIAVALGAFADPNFPPPTRQAYVEHRHPWVGVAV